MVAEVEIDIWLAILKTTTSVEQIGAGVPGLADGMLAAVVAAGSRAIITTAMAILKTSGCMINDREELVVAVIHIIGISGEEVVAEEDPVDRKIGTPKVIYQERGSFWNGKQRIPMILIS